MKIWEKELILSLFVERWHWALWRGKWLWGSSDVSLLSAQPSWASKHANSVKRSKALSNKSCNVQTKVLEVDWIIMSQPVCQRDSLTPVFTRGFSRTCAKRKAYFLVWCTGRSISKLQTPVGRLLRSFGTVRVLSYYDLEAEVFDEKHLADN